MTNTKQVNCGGVKIGGSAPISIQSMTNTKTDNVDETVEQILRLEEAGCQIVRCAVPDMGSAFSISEIKSRIHIPLVADIHFDYKLALEAISAGADKIRINPGNIGGREAVSKVIKSAKKAGIPIRVGVNGGSLEKDIFEKFRGITAEALAESAIRNVGLLEDEDFSDIVVSVKSSNIKINYEAYKILSERIDYSLHIGVTEAGMSQEGIIKSSIGIGSLLMDGIGDTMRVSLTGDPVKEIQVAKDILKSFNMLHGSIDVVSCPTCGRTKVDLESVVQEVKRRLSSIEKKRMAEGRKSLNVAVMGCAVNGPGEAKGADIGLAFGDGKATLFKDGEIVGSYETDEAIAMLISGIEKLG